VPLDRLERRERGVSCPVTKKVHRVYAGGDARCAQCAGTRPGGAAGGGGPESRGLAPAGHRGPPCNSPALEGEAALLSARAERLATEVERLNRALEASREELSSARAPVEALEGTVADRDASLATRDKENGPAADPPAGDGPAPQAQAPRDPDHQPVSRFRAGPARGPHTGALSRRSGLSRAGAGLGCERE
jgi:hypothetical protein